MKKNGKLYNFLKSVYKYLKIIWKLIFLFKLHHLKLII